MKLQPKENVPATPRAAMTKARRLRLWLAHEGRCGGCRAKVPLEGTVMDHFITVYMSGPEDDANLRPLCPACDKPKTANDQAVIAKVKRLRKSCGLDPTSAKPSRKIQSRAFDNSRTRKFSGEVVARGH